MICTAFDLGKAPRLAPRGLTAERARTLLSYDRKSGTFRWKCRRGQMLAGSEAGAVTGGGYRYISIDGHPYLAHQVAWLMETGEWPGSFTIDHRDTVKTNNAWENLRPATQSDQCANVGVRKDNASGFKGVCWSPRESRWRAYVSRDGRQHHVGYFDLAADAAEARRLKAEELHGKFARAA